MIGISSVSSFNRIVAGENGDFISVRSASSSNEDIIFFKRNGTEYKCRIRIQVFRQFVCHTNRWTLELVCLESQSKVQLLVLYAYQVLLITERTVSGNIILCLTEYRKF